MTAAYGDRLREAFDELVVEPVGSRAELARERYADDPKLVQDLLDLLLYVDVHSSFLEPIDATDMRVLLGRSTGGSEWPGEEMPDLSGRVLEGRYELGARLGAGGAGVVHEAHDRLRGGRVAVKVLRDRGRRDRRGLRSEAAALRLLRIPGVVRLLDEGEVEGRAFLVTEHVQGTPFPGRARPVPWSDLQGPTVALLEALERVHRAGVVHGDLKPGNVLVRDDGVPVILDLGIAEGPRVARADVEGATRRGTLRYVAPERARDGILTPRSDLYAVGVMLHEALTGLSFRSEASVAMVRVGLVGERPKRIEDGPEDLPASVRDTIEALLQVDPAARPPSAAAALARLRAGGEIPTRSALALPGEDDPVVVEALRPLFAGPDRVLHLQEDGATELWRRTGGHRERLAGELDAWSRAGIGWWEGDLYRLRRADVGTLAHGVTAFAVSEDQAPTTPDLDPLEQDLVLAVQLSGARATADFLEQVLDAREGVTPRALDRLVVRGVLEVLPSGVFGVVATPGASARIRRLRATRLHRRISRVLPRGDVQRLMHLVAGGALDEVPEEAAAAAQVLLERGDLDGARAAATQGIDLLAAQPETASCEDLLELHLQIVLLMGRRAAIDTQLHQVGRFPLTDRLDRQERIARGVLHVLDGQPQRALEELPPAEEAPGEVERRVIVSARLFAARLAGAAEAEAELERIESLPVLAGAKPIQAAAAAARGWLLYREGRFADSGAAHVEASLGAPLETTRTSSLLNAASAFLDAGQLERAEQLARNVLEFAHAKRHPLLEARAEWIVRAAAYRRGDDLCPDTELVAACSELGNPLVAGSILLGEAAIAWRQGDDPTALRLALAAEEAASGGAARWSRLLARSLAAALEGTPDPAPVRALLAECEACPSPAVAAQAAGLLRRAHPATAPEAAAAAAAFGARVPAERRGLRLEILSVSEAVK